MADINYSQSECEQAEDFFCNQVNSPERQLYHETFRSPKVVLPLGTPFYSTYHFQGLSGAISVGNPSIRNWFLNESMMLSCERVFLYGFSSPHMTILKSSWKESPCFYWYKYSMLYLYEYVHSLIEELIANGYYVNFAEVDDYYLEGKSWYNKRHFSHDGLIYGYDHNDDTYDVYAYDMNWTYRGFKVKKESFDKGRYALMDQGINGRLWGIKPVETQFVFDPAIVYRNLNEYINSTIDKYPLSAEGRINGIVVHQYMAIYLDRLYHGLIQYDKMDWRIFRVIWEQKVFMLERIKKIEEVLNFDSSISNHYSEVVREANTMRMLYASHRQKRRDEVLPHIKKKLLLIDGRERNLLEKLLVRMDGILNNR